MPELIWDRRQEYVYEQTTRERYELITGRYQNFLKNVHDPKSEVIKVFDDLKPKQLEELELIREVSKYLQKKKEDDMKKAAADEEVKKTETEENDDQAKEKTEEQKTE